VRELTEGILSRVEGGDMILLDGTFWWEDELLRVSGIDVSSTALGHIAIERSLETSARWRWGGSYIRISTIRIPAAKPWKPHAR